MADVGCCKFKQENKSKASEYIKLCEKFLTGNDKEGIAHIKNMQSNKMNIIEHIA